MKKLGILLTPLLLVLIILPAVACGEQATITSVPTSIPTDISTSTDNEIPETTPTSVTTPTPTTITTSTPMPTPTPVEATEAPTIMTEIPPVHLNGSAASSSPVSQTESSEAGFDMFMQIDGIPGESVDDNHEDWIDVLSYNFAISQSEADSSTSAGKSIAGQAIQSFTIKKLLDKSSPTLAVDCCKGQHIKRVTLELCHSSGDKKKFMEYKMEDVLISSISVSGSIEGSETIPVETISLTYSRISWAYTEFDDDTGKPKGTIEGEWDLTAKMDVGLAP